jgi:hypothetical protein
MASSWRLILIMDRLVNGHHSLSMLWRSFLEPPIFRRCLVTVQLPEHHCHPPRSTLTPWPILRCTRPYIHVPLQTELTL